MRRVRNEKGGIAAALSEAQKLVFGPFIFQAVVAARRLGILKAFSESTDPLTFKAVAQKCGLSEYAVEVTGDVLTAVGVLTPKAEGYVITKTGDCLLYDPMTVANLDFTADVCYKGLVHLGISHCSFIALSLSSSAVAMPRAILGLALRASTAARIFVSSAGIASGMDVPPMWVTTKQSLHHNCFPAHRRSGFALIGLLPGALTFGRHQRSSALKP